MLQKIKPIADAHGATLSQLVINWTAHQPAIGCVLVGARDEKQVADNAMSLEFKISDTEMNMINDAIRSVKLVD